MRARDPAAALDDRARAGWRSWVAPPPLACALLLAIGLAVVGLVAIKAAGRISFELAAWQGVRLNRAAWEAGFTERGLVVPPAGPRGGYRGARLGKHHPHPGLGGSPPGPPGPGPVRGPDPDAGRVSLAPAVPRARLRRAPRALPGSHA